MFEELLRLTQLPLSQLAAYLRKWAADPLLRSVDVTVTVPVGATTAGATHGLGRSMNGAVITGVDGNYAVSPLLSRSATFVNVNVSPVVASVPLNVKLKVF